MKTARVGIMARRITAESVPKAKACPSSCSMRSPVLMFANSAHEGEVRVVLGERVVVGPEGRHLPELFRRPGLAVTGQDGLTREGPRELGAGRHPRDIDLVREGNGPALAGIAEHAHHVLLVEGIAVLGGARVGRVDDGDLPCLLTVWGAVVVREGEGAAALPIHDFFLPRPTHAPPCCPSSPYRRAGNRSRAVPAGGCFLRRRRVT